jgi:hypothetical protein
MRKPAAHLQPGDVLRADNGEPVIVTSRTAADVVSYGRRGWRVNARREHGGEHWAFFEEHEVVAVFEVNP